MTFPPRGRGGQGACCGRGARGGASGCPDPNTSIDQATVDLRQMIYDEVQAAFEMFRAQQTVEEDDSPTVPGDQPITPILGSGNQLSTEGNVPLGVIPSSGMMTSVAIFSTLSGTSSHQVGGGVTSVTQASHSPQSSVPDLVSQGATGAGQTSIGGAGSVILSSGLRIVDIEMLQ